MNVAEEEALRRIMAVEKLPINWQYDKEAKVLVKTRIDEAWELIRHASPKDVMLSIHTIIGSLLMARLRGYEGGSVSSVIGAIWVGLDPEHPASISQSTSSDYDVHNCLFLDDMVNCIFIDGEQRLGEVDARPKFHPGNSTWLRQVLSLGVCSCDSSELNRRLNRPDRHDFLLSRVPKTLCGLLAKQQFLTPHGRAMLADLNAWVEARKIGSCSNR